MLFILIFFFFFFVYTFDWTMQRCIHTLHTMYRHSCVCWMHLTCVRPYCPNVWARKYKNKQHKNWTLFHIDAFIIVIAISFYSVEVNKMSLLSTESSKQIHIPIYVYMYIYRIYNAFRAWIKCKQNMQQELANYNK